VPATKSSHKRYSQRQLTEIFCAQGNIPAAKTTEMQLLWWMNPTDPHSLRLSAYGLKYAKVDLKLKSYEFALAEELNNLHLMQLERLFQGMYYLMKRQKIIVFEEQEAMMLTLHGNNLKQYLDTIAATI
jgi:hypothetical protein